MASRRSRRPQAARCPPNVSRWSEVRSTAPSRSNAGMLRPDPLASSSPSLSRMAGRWKRSATRDATMPTTPSCHSGDDSTSAAGGGSGTMAIADSSIAASMVWRSRLSSLSLSASGSAASRSALPSSSSAMDASSRRPAALSLGPRRKPTVPASAAPGRPPGDLEQRREARPRRAAQPAEADRGEHPVLLHQRDHVRDGADCHEVGVRAQRQRQVDELVAGIFQERVRQLEGHADAGEVAAGIRAELGRDDGAGGQVALELVVVGDDDVHPERLGLGHLCASVDPAVDRDQELDPGGGQLVHRRRRDAVAVAEAVGQPPAHVRAQVAEDADQQERGRDAVGVVVTVHGDGLAALQRLVDAPPRLGHAAHEIGIVDAEVGVQERARRGGIAEPAADQDLGEDLAHAELPGEPPDVCERRRRYAPGAGIVHECITARVYRAGATEAAGTDSGGLAGPAGVVRLGPGLRALAGVRLRRGLVRRRRAGHGDGGLLAGGDLGRAIPRWAARRPPRRRRPAAHPRRPSRPPRTRPP